MRKILSLTVLIIAFTSCNKYEDGPSISFRSAEKRLSGKWKISQIFYNDKDISTGFFSSKLEVYPFSIFPDWGKNYYICVTHTDGNLIAKSSLTLNDHKTKMTFCFVAIAPYESISNDIFATIPLLQDTTDWKILRLKNDRLWISTNFDENNYELHFDLLADFYDY